MKVLIVLTALLGCSLALHKGFRLSEKSQRVVGGSDAEQGAFPFIISLRYGYSFLNAHVCGGAILSEKWIVTAGHCVTEIPSLPFAGFYAAAGIHKLNDKGQILEVTKNIVHPDYHGDVAPNDIALMQLKESFEFNDFVQPINLPESDAFPTGEAILAGWGSTSTGIIPSLPSILQTINLPLLSHEECVKALIDIAGSSEPLAESNICTGPIDVAGLGACSGDSGGPLFKKTEKGFEIVGIVSWGMIPCGSLGAPSVYTRVGAFNSFILSSME